MALRSDSVETERRTVFFVRQDREGLLDYFNNNCRSLLGSDARVDREGNIFFQTYRDLPRMRVLDPQSEELVQVSRLHPLADFTAPHSRHGHFEEIRIHQIRKDGGTVEAAIRLTDHVLEGQLGREMPHTDVIRSRSRELYYAYSLRFGQMTPEGFDEVQANIYRDLGRVGYNPQTVVDEHKQRMSRWLISGSLGRDSWDRLNMLISLQALGAAYRTALLREGVIGETTGKFARMREALLFERGFDRAIFDEVANRVDPENFAALPAHTLFKNLDYPPSNVGIVQGMLNHMRWQLEQPRVKPYRSAATKTGEVLSQIAELLGQGRRREVVEQGLLPQVHSMLIGTLRDHQDIYQDQDIYSPEP